MYSANVNGTPINAAVRKFPKAGLVICYHIFWLVIRFLTMLTCSIMNDSNRSLIRRGTGVFFMRGTERERERERECVCGRDKSATSSFNRSMWLICAFFVSYLSE